jgi:hypothetical protein
MGRRALVRSTQFFLPAQAEQVELAVAELKRKRNAATAPQSLASSVPEPAVV